MTHDLFQPDEDRPTKAEAEELDREAQEHWEALPEAEKDRIRKVVGSDPWENQS
jgi:hypothetical protein